MSELGTFVRVFWKSGDSNDFDKRHQSLFERLFTVFIAEEKNSIIAVKDVNGAEIFTSASNIASIHMSTPEARENWYPRSALFEQEEALYTTLYGCEGESDEAFN
jgi:hypothetical protein